MSNLVELDVTNFLDKFNRLHDQMPFLISRSMNDTAFLDTRDDLSKDMTKSLIIRKKTIASKTMFQVVRSNKTNLEVKLFHKIPEIGYQQVGGTETPRGKKLAIPVRKNLSRYAGIAENKTIPKRLQISTLIQKAPSDRSKAVYNTGGLKPFILKTGVFIRQGSSIRALYYFVDQAQHTKKSFDFQETVIKSFNRRFTKRFQINYLKILKG